MPKQETFEYAVIRYVPRVEREEFMNIGVIVFSKRKKFLEVKFQVSEAKLKAFSEEVNVAELKDYLKSWQLISKGDKDGGKIASLEMPYRFRWLTAARSTIIQSSRPHPGLCEDPQEVLNDLFDKYVK